MNYYNPYFYSYPYAPIGTEIAKTGMFSRLFGGINMSSILSGTQKTLKIVNQTIPLIKQASPIIKNAKTMFKVMNEFKKVDTPSNNSQINENDYKEQSDTKSYENIQESTNTNQVGPTFFA